MTSKGNQGKTSFHLCEICGCKFFFYLKLNLTLKVGVAAVGDQTEQVFSLWKKTDFAFFINIVRFINFSVLNV